MGANSQRADALGARGSNISPHSRRSCIGTLRVVGMTVAASTLLCVALCVPWTIHLAAAQGVPQPASPPQNELQQVASRADVDEPASSAAGTPRPKNAEPKATDQNTKVIIQVSVVAASMAILVGVVTALLTHLSTFRTQLNNLSTNDTDSRRLFFQMALGVPDGTIRSSLAILIVLGALLTLIAAIGSELGLHVPDALSGIFGTILGFYFGRPGSVEAAQTSSAMAGAAQSTAQAAQTVSEVKQQAAQSEAALKAVQGDQLSALSAQADSVLSVMSSIVGTVPPPIDPSIQNALVAGRAALDSAKQSANMNELKLAFAKLVNEGPIAALIRSSLSSLSGLARAGTSTIDAIRAFVTLSGRLPPVVAQIWAARVLRQPYRVELYSPAVNDAYATSIIGQVPGGGALLTKLQTVNPSLTTTEFVSMVIAEDGAAQIANRSNGLITVEDAVPVVDSMQQRSMEVELRKSLTNDDATPFGDLTALFASLDKVQADPSGLRGLDNLMLIVREARNATISPSDVLPSMH
jgi:hypothetical protein